MVEYDGESFVIESSLLFDEEGSVWSCHLLDGANDGATRWLSVNDDDRLEIGLYAVQAAGSVAVDGEPPQSLEVAGVAYSLAEQGTARVRKRDCHGTRDHGRCRYADYKGRDDQRLAIEWWGETTEVAIGQLVPESELLIMQGA